MKNYRIGQNILPTEWHFVKSAKMAVYPPYKNPVFPPPFGSPDGNTGFS